DDTLALDGGEEFDWVEAAGGEGDDTAAQRQRGDGGERARAVHERAGGETHRARLASEAVSHGVEVLFGRVVQCRLAEGGVEIVVAPHHAFGHAGGATGVEEVKVVAAAAPWSSPPGAGHALVRRFLVGHSPIG